MLQNGVFLSAHDCCTYYVDNAGSDSANGLTPATAWQTVAKVNAATFVGGQSVGFKRGGTWRETLTPGQSGSAGNPIIFTAFGSGAQPIFNGADVITGWGIDGPTAADTETFESGSISGYWTTITGAADTAIFKTGTTSWKFTGGAGTVEKSSIGSNYGEIISWIRVDSSSFSGNGQQTNLLDFEGGSWNGANGVNLILDRNGSAQYQLSVGRTGVIGTTPFNISTNTWYAVRLAVTANGTPGTDHAELYVNTTGAPWGAAVSTITGMTLSSPINTHVRFGKLFNNAALVTVNYDDLSVYITDSTAAGQANVYDATVVTIPNQVFSNGVRLAKAASKAALVDQQWFWASNVLNIQSNAGNPDTLGLTIEASSRNAEIKLNSVSYITVSGLAVTKANLQAINIGSSATDHLTITGNTLTYAASDAIVVFSVAAGLTNGVITNNVMAWNGAQGVYLLGPTTGSNTISYNTIYNNCQIYFVGAPLVDNQYCGGIRLLADLGSGNVVTQNTVYNNGYAADNVTPTSGTNATAVGIWLDCGAGTGSMPSVLVSYNVVYNNAFDGIRSEDCSSHKIIYNVSYGNVRSSPQSGGITMTSYNHLYPTSGNLIYNNTLYGNRVGLNLLGYSTGAAGVYTNNLIKNNLSIGSTLYALQADYGADNDGTMGSGNIYTYNGLGVQDSNFIGWGNAFSTFYSTYAAWQGATGAGVGITDHYLSSDPLFTNAAGGDFTLQVGSPAIGTGIFIAGVSTSNPPNFGAK